MALILNAIAFLPQEFLAQFTGSPRKCFMCKSPYGVYGIKHGVALPCGFIVGECVKCYASIGCRGAIATDGKQERRKYILRDISSSEIECPYCGAAAVGCDPSSGKQDHTAVAALHGAEGRLGSEQKEELRRLLERQISAGGGVASTAGWRRNEDDGEWEQYEDADDGVKGHTADDTLEMDFNDILEMGIVEEIKTNTEELQMHARDPFDPKIIIAHIKKQQGPQRPRERVEFIPSTFTIDNSESQSRQRESKREAISQLTDKREAYRKHKKTFPSLDSLARPEHILQLASLPGARKVLILGKMIKLWQTINSPTSTHRDYERAVRKLSDVSSLVHGAVKQGDTERVAIQNCLENLNLSVGLKACGICLAPFGDGRNEAEATKVELLTAVSEMPILLPCCHLACHGCMTCWLRERSYCPCCDMMFEDGKKLKITMDSQVRHYDYELAEALDLL